MNDLVKSQKFKYAAIAVGSAILAIIIFSAGIFVGLKKARFSYSWGENYERNFARPFGGPEMMHGPLPGPMEMMRDFEGRDFRNGHGVAGEIISITGNNIVLKDLRNNENTIAVSDKTIIKQGRDNISLNDLKNNQKIVVLGQPGENGVINADLIRVFNVVNGPTNSASTTDNNSTPSKN
jgi:hypothetical protein